VCVGVCVIYNILQLSYLLRILSAFFNIVGADDQEMCSESAITINLVASAFTQSLSFVTQAPQGSGIDI
jgi:hypothetical protein